MNTELITKLHPYGARLLVECLEEPTTPGSIIVIQAPPSVQLGKILSTGWGTIKNDDSITSLMVKESDVVLFSASAGIQLSSTHRLLKEDDILGIVEEYNH